jgi:hypothetical protein
VRFHHHILATNFLTNLRTKGAFTLSGNLARLPAETTCRVGLPG